MSHSGGQGPSGDGPRGERLQKVLARAGVGSRRGVEEMIREGRITVNGKLAVLGQRVDLGADAVKVDGRRVTAGPVNRRYVLLNKPAGCVSTCGDPEGRPTVIDLLPQRLRKGLFPVGRLDFDTEGLLILTDDGELAHQVAHPRHGCRKVYEVKVKGRPREAEVDRLKDGVMIEGRRAMPLAVKAHRAPLGHRGSVSNSWWTVTLGEGRTRQIREMFFRIGHPVNRLRRVAIGPITDPRLPLGGWREMTADEVDRLRSSPAAAPPGARSRRPRRPGSAPAPGGARRGPGRTGPGRSGSKRGGPGRTRPGDRGPGGGDRGRGGPGKRGPGRGGRGKPGRGGRRG